MEKLPVEVLHMIISRFEYCIPYDARFDRTASKFKVTTAHALPVEWKSDLESLRNLRLTCRTLSHPATRALLNVATVAWYPGDLEKYPYLRQSLTDPAETLLVASGSPVPSMIKSLKVDFSAFYKAPSGFEMHERQTSCFEIAEEDDHEKARNARVLVEQLEQILVALPKLKSLAILSGSWEGIESHTISFTPVLDLSLIDAFSHAISEVFRGSYLVHLTKLHLHLPHPNLYYDLSRSMSRQLLGQLKELCLSIGDDTAQDEIQQIYSADIFSRYIQQMNGAIRRGTPLLQICV